MADSSIPVTAGSGTNVDTFTQASGDHRQAVVLGDATAAYTQRVSVSGDALVSITNPTAAAAGIFAGITAYGSQRVAMDPVPLFVDTFDGTTVDAVKWVTSGTTGPTQANGRAQVEPGAVASGSSGLRTTTSFAPTGSSFQGIGLLNTFENNTASGGVTGYTNSHRFFGLGSIPATWVAAYTANSSTGPLFDGVGYEVDTDGAMYAVIYANGVRVRAGTLSTGRTLFDGNAHQFQVVFRTDAVFWYIDGTDVPAASLTYRSAGFLVPATQNLPLRIHTVTGTTAPATAPVHRPAAIAVADTGRSADGIADGTYAWRRASVSRSAALGTELLPRQTYTMGLSGMAATNVGVVATLTGSATKVVRIVRVQVAVIAGASTAGILKLERCSGLTGGTTAAATVAPTDSANIAATATALGYTATPTATSVAYLGQKVSTGTVLGWEWVYGDSPEQQPILRGTAQVLALRNMVAIGTSGAWHITVEWTEETEGA